MRSVYGSHRRSVTEGFHPLGVGCHPAASIFGASPGPHMNCIRLPVWFSSQPSLRCYTLSISPSILTRKVGTVAAVALTGATRAILHVETHPKAFDIVTVKDASGNAFSTRKENVFIIVHRKLHHKCIVSHQKKGKGVKLSILEERMRIFDFSTPFDF
eukprot:gene31762-42359_t